MNSQKRKDLNWKILLSHHPSCPAYENHTFKLFGLEWCIGCFIGFPSLAMGIILSHMWIHRNYHTEIIVLNLIFGIMLFLFQMLSLFEISEKKGVKMLQKGAIGTGSGLILVSTYYLLPFQIIFRIIILTILLIMGDLPIKYLHLQKSKKICNNCPNKWDKEKCPTDYSFADGG
ncbi:MAG: hypothetical protein DRO88_08040 [Promethearchaeia archaeon]|nr:MAG: hypothetical protein DRO88_08040 [Candidatus Lokiarchaeia archaeon]